MQSRICTALYLVSGGGVLYFDGVLISTINRNSGGVGEQGTSQKTAGSYLVAEFTGCLLSMVFMVSLTLLKWVVTVAQQCVSKIVSTLLSKLSQY